MTKQIHNLQQGSPEWHQFRANHYTASDASAMLGLSPYKSRTELLQEKKTGIAKDIDPATQRIFDCGHEIEALARPLAEAYINDDLYPVVCSNGLLSASCDGLTMNKSIAWECKSFNAADFEIVSNGQLPDKHWPQCQQVLYVTGAEKLLFTISDGADLVAHIWVYPNQAQQDRIIAGWELFKDNLDNFVITEPVAEPVAEAIPQLPALSVITRGEVVQSNLPQFKQVAIGFIKSVNTDLQTDQDFVNAKAFVKFAQEGEDKLEAQEGAILAQTADIDLAIRTIREVKAELRSKRLEVDKLVKSREQAIKIEIKLAGESDWHKYKSELQAGIKGIQLVLPEPDIAGAMKNKRTIDSLRNAVNTEVANAKVSAAQVAHSISDKLKFMDENASKYRFLFNDLQAIIYKPIDDLQLIVSTRIEQHKKAEAERLEQERQRIAAEEKAKAERKAAEELRLQQEAERQAKAAEIVQEVAIEQAQAKEPTPAALRETADKIAQAAEYADKAEDRNREIARAAELLVLGVRPRRYCREIARAAELRKQATELEWARRANLTPNRWELVGAIADNFDVTRETAEKWLIAEFGGK